MAVSKQGSRMLLTTGLTRSGVAVGYATIYGGHGAGALKPHQGYVQNPRL